MASRGINKVILVGMVGKDPEVRYMPNGGAVVNLSIATSESWKDQQGQQQERTEWHRLTAYKKTAEIIGQYVKKGAQLYIEGKLKTRKWQDQSGADRYSTEIMIDNMQMLGSATGGGSNNKPANNQGNAPQYAHKPAQQPMSNTNQTPEPDMNFDDDIPFAPIGLQYRALLSCI